MSEDAAGPQRKALCALAFDVQGTVVDFHRPVLRMGADVNAAKGLDLDWAALLKRWRALYREAMDAIIAGRREWLRVDRIYLDALTRLLEEEGVSALFDHAERDAINAVWTRLEPWPDALEGLQRLRKRFTLSTLSNAGMAQTVALVKRAALPFDAVLTAELAQSYKPAAAVYRIAAEYLGFAPGAIMMVACHKYDLFAAKTAGMRTAFVARPLEFGPDACPDMTPEPAFDFNARDFLDLAEQLDA